jgi:hypothetical protein
MRRTESEKRGTEFFLLDLLLSPPPKEVREEARLLHSSQFFLVGVSHFL